jgi:hypothetical protein
MIEQRAAHLVKTGVRKLGLGLGTRTFITRKPPAWSDK